MGGNWRTEKNSAMATPVQKKTIVKKKTKKFTRFQAHMYQRIGSTKKLASWRVPRGIDCSARRGFRGEIRKPKIGYGSNKKTAHMVPNGFLKFLVTPRRTSTCFSCTTESTLPSWPATCRRRPGARW